MLTAKKMFNLMAGRGFSETRALIRGGICRSFSSTTGGWKQGVLTMSVGLPKETYTGGTCPKVLPLHFLTPTWPFNEKKSPRTFNDGRPIQLYRGVPTLDAEFETKLEVIIELYWMRMAKVVWHKSGVVMSEEAVKQRMEYIWIHHGWKLDYTPSQYFEVLLDLYDRFGFSGILQSFWKNLIGSDKFVTFTDRAGCIGTTGEVLRSLVIDHMALSDSNVTEQSMIEVRSKCFHESTQRWFKDILLYVDTKAGGLDLHQEIQPESRLKGKGITWSKADSEIIYIPLPPV